MKETSTEIATINRRPDLVEAANTVNRMVLELQAQEGGEVDEAFTASYRAALQQERMAVDQTAKRLYYKAKEIAAIKDEEKYLEMKRKRLEAETDQLKEVVLAVIKGRGIAEDGKCRERLRGHIYSLKASKKPRSVDITDAKQLPDWALRTMTKTEPNKDAIGNALREGKEVPGAKLSNTNYSLETE